MGTELRRRGFLALGIAGAASVASARWAAAVNDGLPFVHGVASGDPLADRVILWTRVTPTADASPGSGVGPCVRVTWEVAKDAAFRRVAARGAVDTGAQRDHTVKVDITRLQPGTDYWYRFRALGATSPVGHTRTAPPLSDTPGSVRLGLVSCASWEWGYYGAYRLLAAQDVDAVLHLGDYIYEYGTEGPVPGVGGSIGREHQPPHECLSLTDYRIRHGQYKLDTDLQALHAAHPVIAVWDDHEVANDTWRDGAQNHQNEEGDFATRARAARQAWREWLPARPVDPADPETINRRFRFGDLVELWMLDERRYRDQQPQSTLFAYGSVDPAADDPSRSMLGAEQHQWLVGGLGASDAAWKVLGNQVPFFPLVIGAALPSTVETLIAPIRDQLPLAVPPNFYIDDWNGYKAERRALTAAFATLPDVVILTGDVHETFVADIPADPGGYWLNRRSVAVEFIVPAISSASLSRGINQVAYPVGDLINIAYETNLAVGNPWVKYHDGHASGFGIVDFTTTRAQCDLWHLNDVNDRNTTGHVAASWQTQRGTNHATRATNPLQPRA
jgi:alkaline phosphatase D